MPTPIRIGINGFGRIGRSAFKVAFEKKNCEIVAINDLSDNKALAHLLKYDTAYGRYNHEVASTKTQLVVDKKKIPVTEFKEPDKIPWKKYKVDVVLECTGRFLDAEGAAGHIKAGAKRVVLSAPGKGEGIQTLVLGVNEKDDKGEAIISNASCTTNCISPVAYLLNKHFGVKKAMMTTVHSYTTDQVLQDNAHKDLRRARAAAQNIIPTTTGAAIATTETIPELKGKFDGLAIRVPTITVSLSDFTFLLKKKTTAAQVNNVFKRAAANPYYKGILAVTNEPLVSSDFIGDPHSSTIDLGLTKVVDGDMVKVIAWYDNEWGYSNRLVEMAIGAIKKA
ncbi:MAG: type I glyceraldehyde-3-phosphate dehydrogenase [Patescibacteria group bacterium]|jgi:glyceraldehyde 3-phosphate dehydrogenase